MRIQLQSLILHNFRGIRDLTLNLGGANACISGANAAGKTTIADAFLWLLFNKDSEDRQCDPKTRDNNDQPIHNLDHEVEVVLTADGRRVTLRKLYKEKWVRSRGKSQQEFEGHTTEYWVNDEPMKAKDFTAYVSGFVGEEIFRLITNPLYFSTNLHWEKRRQILLALCGEVSREAVISAGGGDLQGLADLLDGRTAETARKVIQDKRRRTNDELEKIPAQIEAVTRTIPELREDYAEIEAALADCRKEASALDEEAQNASRALEPIREKGRELARLEQERANLTSRMDRESRAGYDEARRNRERLEDELNRQERAIERHREEYERWEAGKKDCDR